MIFFSFFSNLTKFYSIFHCYNSTEEYYSNCCQLIEAQNTKALLLKLLEQKNVILAVDDSGRRIMRIPKNEFYVFTIYDSITEVEGFFQSLFSVIYTLSELDESPLVRVVIDELKVVDVKSLSKMCLRALIISFNLIFNFTYKFEALEGTYPL